MDTRTHLQGRHRTFAHTTLPGTCSDGSRKSGAVLLAATLDGIADGAWSPTAAGEDPYAPKIVVDDARINWHDPAPAVDRLVRATDPAPGAWTEFRGERLKLGRADDHRRHRRARAGELRVDKHRVLVNFGHLRS